jgi:hypothetical protein
MKISEIKNDSVRKVSVEKRFHPDKQRGESLFTLLPQRFSPIAMNVREKTKTRSEQLRKLP